MKDALAHLCCLINLATERPDEPILMDTRHIWTHISLAHIRAIAKATTREGEIKALAKAKAQVEGDIIEADNAKGIDDVIEVNFDHGFLPAVD